MSPSRSLAVCRHELRVLRRRPGQFLQILLMPLAMIAFLKPAFQSALEAEGYLGANGAEQAVPGLTVMFTFFGVGFVGFSFFEEHAFNTWERLRASTARPAEIMIGKIVPAFALGMAMQVILLGVGGALFGLRVKGSYLALGAVAVCLALSIVVFGVVLAAFCRSSQQLNMLSNLGVMILSGLGGAMTPLSVLPSWARGMAPLTPTYWAMRGFRNVVLDGGGLADIALPCLTLLVFTALFALVATTRFRFEETKAVAY